MREMTFPAMDILGMTMAAVTVITSAGVLLKHEFQDVTLSRPNATESDSDDFETPPEPIPKASKEFMESLQGFSSTRMRAAEDQIYQALEKPCPNLDYPGETDLRDILGAIIDQLKRNEGDSFNAIEDVGAFDEDSIDLDGIKIRNFHMEDVSIRSAFDELFEQTDPKLDYMVRSEGLLITTRQATESEENQTVRIYDISHLVSRVSKGGGSQVFQHRDPAAPCLSRQQVAQWIVNMTAPPARWFEIDGEGGKLEIYNHMLIVRQTRRAHLAIADLLEQVTEHRDLLQN